MTRASKQTKSTMQASIGCWRRKRKPANCFLRIFCQTKRSVSVMFERNSRARSRNGCFIVQLHVAARLAPPPPPPPPPPRPRPDQRTPHLTTSPPPPPPLTPPPPPP